MSTKETDARERVVEEIEEIRNEGRDDGPNPGDPGPAIPPLGSVRDDPRDDPKLPRDHKRPPPAA